MGAGRFIQGEGRRDLQGERDTWSHSREVLGRERSPTRLCQRVSRRILVIQGIAKDVTLDLKF